MIFEVKVLEAYGRELYHLTIFENSNFSQVSTGVAIVVCKAIEFTEILNFSLNGLTPHGARICVQ